MISGGGALVAIFEKLPHCPECKERVGKGRYGCTHCGYEFTTEDVSKMDRSVKSIRQQIVFWSVLLAVAILFFLQLGY